VKAVLPLASALPEELVKDSGEVRGALWSASVSLAQGVWMQRGEDLVRGASADPAVVLAISPSVTTRNCACSSKVGRGTSP
jgi:hypothetical protein